MAVPSPSTAELARGDRPPSPRLSGQAVDRPAMKPSPRDDTSRQNSGGRDESSIELRRRGPWRLPWGLEKFIHDPASTRSWCTYWRCAPRRSTVARTAPERPRPSAQRPSRPGKNSRFDNSRDLPLPFSFSNACLVQRARLLLLYRGPGNSRCPTRRRVAGCVAPNNRAVASRPGSS